MPLFEWFIKESSSFREAKTSDLDNAGFTLRLPCSSIKGNFATVTKILVDLHKMTEGHLDTQPSWWLTQTLERTDEALSAATAQSRPHPERNRRWLPKLHNRRYSIYSR